jgi:hypothetical protein
MAQGRESTEGDLLGPAKPGIMGTSKRWTVGRRRLGGHGYAWLRQIHGQSGLSNGTRIFLELSRLACVIKYSPAQKVKPRVCYQDTLVTAPDHDDRVGPSHSFKFRAAMQGTQAFNHDKCAFVVADGVR